MGESRRRFSCSNVRVQAFGVQPDPHLSSFHQVQTMELAQSLVSVTSEMMSSVIIFSSSALCSGRM